MASERMSDGGLLLTLVSLAAGAIGFGSWMQSAGAGWWMFVLLMWAEGFSENLKR